MATRLRKGFIKTDQRPRGPYYSGFIGIGGRIASKCSYDRSVVERWLEGMLAEHPTYEVDTNRPAFSATMSARRMAAGGRHVPKSNPFAGSRSFGVTETPSLWMVVAETNPMTASYHIYLRHDWPRPAKVLAYDNLSETPVAWVADDNGGEGYGSGEAARVAALVIAHDPSVMLTVRPLSRRWRDGGTGCGDGQKGGEG